MGGKLFVLRQAFNFRSVSSLKNNVTLIPQANHPIRSTPASIFSQISRTLCSSSSVSSDTRQPSLARLPFVDAFLAKAKNNKSLLSNRKIYSRRSTILPEFVDQTVRIYNGKNFVRCKITEGKVGHKFGEFALTRKRKHLRSKAEPAKKKGKK
ncbi:hypothetical protein J1N35_016193 [Gossypium stocksii]|uniref:Ribosomal protein S19 n=1 Tax=Gossypium stocksii TaxID=47602 RepID=A0A9D3VXR9_9ROSI|nr:hypothetical protein J1N35_016193 [Gossypium stocksii]